MGYSTSHMRCGVVRDNGRTTASGAQVAAVA